MSVFAHPTQLPVKDQIPERFRYRDSSNSFIGTRVGYDSIITKDYPAQGSITSNGSVNFNMNFTGQVDSAWRLKVQKTVTLTFASGALGIADLYNSFGLRSYPINRIIRTMNIGLGSDLSQSTNSRDFVPLVERSIDVTLGQLISQASKPDGYTTWSDQILDDPLRNGTDTLHGYESRGFGNRYEIRNVTLASATTITFDYVGYERIMAVPLQWMERVPQPFPDLRSATAMWVIGDLDDMWCNNTGVAVTLSYSNVRASIVTETFVPSLAVPRPSLTYYNTPFYNLVKEDPTSITAGSSTSYQCQSYTNPSVPSMLGFMFLQDGSLTSPAITGTITNLSLSVNNYNAQLAELDVTQLYELSVKNGYNGRFGSFAGLNCTNGGAGGNIYGNGNLVLVRPSNMGLGGIQSNQNVQFDFQALMTLNNYTGSTISGQMYVFRITDGILMVQQSDSGARFAIQKLTVDSELILAAARNQFSYVDDNYTHNVLGGGFLDSLWSGAKELGNALKPIALSAAKTVAQRGVDRLLKGRGRGGNVLKVGRGRRRGGAVMEEDELFNDLEME